MTFPQTVLPVKMELYYSGAWNDITSDTRRPVTITRGQSSEQLNSGQLPSRMTFNLNNRTGKYSPRNPNSVLYGLIGRNTQIRCSVSLGTVRSLQGSAEQFSCPDSAAISITGDIDLRVDIDSPSWRPSTTKYIGLVKGGSYWLQCNSDGTITIGWVDGSAVTKSSTSTEPIPGGEVGRKAVRAVLDVNNGAAGHTARFYYATPGDLTGATWTQLGTDVVTAGTTSIADTTQTLGSYSELACEVFDLEVRNGIAGTIVAKPAFTTRTNGATSFSDSYSNTWTAAGTASVTNRHYLFWGDVPSWPQRWDVSGTDIWVPIEAAGILRRLSQGITPVDSPYKQGISALTSCVAYWPMEDGVNATRFDASVGTRYGTFFGSPALASDSSFVCSNPLPVIGSARAYFPVDNYTNTGSIQVRWLGKIPAATPNNAVIARIRTTNTLGWYDLIYGTGGGLTLKAYTSHNVLSLTIGPIAFGVDDTALRFDIEAKQNGANVDFTVATLAPGATSGTYTTGTATGVTLGSCSRVDLNPDGAALTGLVFGQLTVETAIASIFNYSDQLAAYDGELAQQRFSRICSDNGITSFTAGYSSGGTLMGVQGIASPLTIARDAVAADTGLLYEQQGSYGLAVRPVETLYNQETRHTISYADNNLQLFEPTEDDQNIRNKVTVTRMGSSSATAEDTTSALSTQDPPNGVGTYDDSVSLSLHGDIQTEQQAGWRVHLGTVDEARYPQIGVNLAHPDFASDITALYDLLRADIGDRLDVSNPPSWMPPDAVQQLILGQTIRLDNFECSITYNCRPYRPYRAAFYKGSGTDRYSNDNTKVNGAHNSSTTSLSVKFASGPEWTHADGDFDIMVAGERMTVTAITGTATPQTFTVTRSVNGVIKAHSDGESVTLYDPVYYGL